MEKEAGPFSECHLLCELATRAPHSDGGLSEAVTGVRLHKKNVHIPSYGPFAAQGWDGLFSQPAAVTVNGDGGPKQQETQQAANGGQDHPFALQNISTLLSPPAAFFRSHLAGELPSILDAIGCTPLVRLSRIAAAARCACQLLGKCEFLSAGGSIKDRIARGMVGVAEATEQLEDGAALIEPTSGNTGIGLALVAAVKGYQSVAVMPMKMSAEKHRIMKALGATILRTPTKAAWNDQTSHIALSIRLQEEIEQQHAQEQHANGASGAAGAATAQKTGQQGISSNGSSSRRHAACILDQYRNPANPLSHFYGTGTELLYQSGEKLDMVVIGAGTGGSLTGIAKRIKMALPNCVIVAVDPEGSILADPTSPPGKPYLVEGIGYDFVPTVLDRAVADIWVRVNDAESLLCSRLLIRHEGMLVGGSAGAALAGALKAIEQKGWRDDSSKRIAIILPDGSRNYTSKFVCDEWMTDKGFTEPSVLMKQYPAYGDLCVDSLELPPLHFIESTAPLKAAAQLMVKSPQQVLCVVQPGALHHQSNGSSAGQHIGGVPVDAIVGSISQSSLLAALGDLPASTEVGEVADTETAVFSEQTRLSRVAQSLELRPFVFIETGGLVKAAVGEKLMLEAFVAKQQRESSEA
ncbi:hypothetical protein Efla_001036 [Eimeria flavescens]